jgi:hypothetical protein
MDEDGRHAKESEVARDRQGGMAVYLHRGCLQPLPLAKPHGQNLTRSVASGPSAVESGLKSLLLLAAKKQISSQGELEHSFFNKLLVDRLAAGVALNLRCFGVGLGSYPRKTRN